MFKGQLAHSSALPLSQTFKLISPSPQVSAGSKFVIQNVNYSIRFAYQT